MGRLIRVNQDLSGATIDVASLSEGHARQSYIGRCDLSNATVLGDIRGSDILECNLSGTDLSQADTYGCLWTGSTFDAASALPSDTGAEQREIYYERIRRIIPQIPPRWRQRCKDILAAHAAGDYATFCALIADVWTRKPQVMIDIWQAMPPRARRFLRQVVERADCANPTASSTVTWPDGVSVTVDKDNLPVLPRPYDRYELARWVEAQAGPWEGAEGVTWESGGRWCWVGMILPMPRVHMLLWPDEWWQVEREEY